MIKKAVNGARIHDMLALFVTSGVIALDLWTKSLIVTYLSPPRSKSVALIGHYLMLYYVQNRGAAFSLLNNTAVLIMFIVGALIAVGYLYWRYRNASSWYYKVILGLIIGGALGNVLNRLTDGGYVVDFIAFGIPQLNFHFAIFNIADASLSIGVLLFFVCQFFIHRPHSEQETTSTKAAISDEETYRMKG